MFLGVYHNGINNTNSISHKFTFVLSKTREELPKRLGSLELIKQKTIPTKYRTELLEHPTLFENNTPELGSIHYLQDKQTNIASSFKYFPKEGLGKDKMYFGERQVKGLPYWLEAIALKHLKELNVSHFMTSEYALSNRIDQLVRVGINPSRPTPIDEALRKLAKGYRNKN